MPSHGRRFHRIGAYKEYNIFILYINVSGSVCNNESQFVCGVTSLCISSSLVCDGVKHCPGGEDEDGSACSHRRDSPLLEMLRRFAARNQEFLGLDQPDGVTKPSVISKTMLIWSCFCYKEFFLNRI